MRRSLGSASNAILATTSMMLPPAPDDTETRGVGGNEYGRRYFLVDGRIAPYRG